eukprot:1048012-Rhodomonas_salina.1
MRDVRCERGGYEREVGISERVGMGERMGAQGASSSAMQRGYESYAPPSPLSRVPLLCMTPPPFLPTEHAHARTH